MRALEFVRFKSVEVIGTSSDLRATTLDPAELDRRRHTDFHPGSHQGLAGGVERRVGVSDALA